MSTSLKQRFVSLEEYFALDVPGGERWVFRNGEVLAMGGAQPEHNLVCVNLLRELSGALRGRGC